MTLQRPLPPRSVVKLSRLWPHARRQGHEVGEIRRIGYYTPQDGLDCVWLVSSGGDYDWTADHDWIERHFDVVSLSDEADLFGVDRPAISVLPGGSTAEQIVAPNRSLAPSLNPTSSVRGSEDF
jgi:hypothetical protein